MRILFIHLNGPDNMSARTLHSLVDKAGFDVKSIFFRNEFYGADVPPKSYEVKLLLKLIKKLEPSIICFGVNSMRFYDSVTLTKIIKKYIGVPVLWGGVQPTIEPERCLEYCDYICVGEGDEAIVEFLMKFKNKDKLDNIKNIWLKKGDKIISNKLRPLIEDLNKLPFPDYTDKNKYYLIDGKISMKNPIIIHKYHHCISTSRGCPFQCNYCFNHQQKSRYGPKHYRRRSVDHVINELILVKKFHPMLEYIFFFDDVFIIDKKWMLEFKEKYLKYINLPFFCFGYVSLINDELLKIAVDAGLQELSVGVQSGSERIRKLYNRFESDEMIIKAAKIMNKYPIVVRYSMITSEFETKEDTQNGLKLFLKLPKPFSSGINKMAYYPTFGITQIALDQGKISKDQVITYTKNRVGQPLEDKDLKMYIFANYYYLLGNRFIPNFIVQYMFENGYETHHPNILISLAKIGKSFRYLDSLKWLSIIIRNGEFRYLALRFKKILKL